MSSLAQINVKFSADLKQFSSQMQNAQRSIKRMGRNMQKVGKSLTIGVTVPLLAIGVAGVRAWDKQQKAIAQVNAGLKTTAGAVGYTSEQLQKLASELQGNSLFGDEEILKDATAQLLTFTNIANAQFARTQQAALDLATRLGGDLKSSSIQLGKALNDPVANLSALSRSGIQFSKEQKAVINALVKTNRLADAQTIILDELEKQYGGSAAAAAKAGLGPFQQLANIIGDLNEEFGAIIAEALLPFVEKIKGVVAGFKELSPETKKFIVIAAGIAAAVGPLLALAGVVLPAIASGFALLISPIGLIVAGLTAIGVIIYKNWQPIKKNLVDIANYFIDLYNESTVFRFAVDAVTVTFKNMWTTVKFIFNALGSILKAVVTSFVTGFKIIGKAIKGALTFDTALIKEAWEDYKKAGLDTTVKLIANLKKDWQKLNTGINNNLKAAIEGGGKRAKIVLTTEQIDTTAISNAVTTAISRQKATAIIGSSVGVDNSLSPFEGIKEEMALQVDGMNKEQIRAVENAQIFNEQFNAAIQDTAFGVAEGMGEIVAGLASGTVSTESIFKFFLSSFADLAIRIGKIAIGVGISIAAIEKALSTLNPYVAIAAGVALVAIGTLAKSQLSKAATPFAEGGIVSGPTLALVGEYAGASSNPEVIAPLNKLKDLIGINGGVTDINIHGQFEIDGQKLRLVLDRSDKQTNRFGG